MIRITIILLVLICTIASFSPMLYTNNEAEEIAILNTNTNSELDQKINTLNKKLINAAKSKDFSSVKQIYTDDALLLTDYHPIIDGISNIEIYYSNIFQKQDVTIYTKETTEILDLGNRIMEIGTFQKTCTNMEPLHGKYWNVWKPLEDGQLRLESESFGYSHKVADLVPILVKEIQEKAPGPDIRNGKKILPELQAYDAFGKEHVRERNVEKVICTYTEDCKYYRFANTVIEGRENLEEYYKGYYGHPVTIDSISISTYDYTQVNNGFIKYSKFYVEWTVPDFSGKTEGTNTIFWRREEDCTLKKHRLIGFHLPDTN
ncbi:YybH family protein [Aquimarina spongiae]|uniref:Ketosteroid isomerase homolog n=1 Tax=Aquimarina spongiae TaxID=570521 RepID=A0A1M6ELV0_9FLAO|nr:nuclear transport factor 2 family protein [Aquimarina spongiae]SHI86434.1 Ketosteroid isomerase homolog [Aquimarina spongiae]